MVPDKSGQLFVNHFAVFFLILWVPCLHISAWSTTSVTLAWATCEASWRFDRKKQHVLD